jgi:hypothetical protein
MGAYHIQIEENQKQREILKEALPAEEQEEMQQTSHSKPCG